VADEVEKINPDLIVRDKEGKPYSVRYDPVNAMLLNEFLKAHRQMDEQQKQINALTRQIKDEATEIRKVKAELELRKPAPQTVLNNP
jgi:trimeric autotransporter adhesin